MIKELYATLEKFAVTALGGAVNVYPATAATDAMQLPACIINLSIEPKSNLPHKNASARSVISFSLFAAAEGEDSEGNAVNPREVLEGAGDALLRSIFQNDPNDSVPEEADNGVEFYDKLFFESISEVTASSFGNAPCLRLELQASGNFQA